VTGPCASNMAWLARYVPFRAVSVESGLPIGFVNSTWTPWNSNRVAASYVDTVSPDTSGQLDVTLNFTLASPASLGSGYFKSSISVAICYDSACTHGVAGSPITVPVQYEVFLTQGKEYTLASSSQGGVSDLAYDAINQQLYVTSLAGYSGGAPGTVSQIDPATGHTVAQASLSDDLATIAVSDDGQLLYAGSRTNTSIYRLTLPALQSDIAIPLGSGNTPLGPAPNIAAQMAVPPGAAHTLAVALTHPGSIVSQGIVLFDDAVARTQAIAPLGDYTSADSIAWGASAATLYAYRVSDQLPLDREIDELQADASGLSVQNAFNLTGNVDTVGQIAYDGGTLYESSGFLRDAGTGASLAQLVLPDDSPLPPATDRLVCVTPDTKNSRLFVLAANSQSSHLMLFVYTLPGLALQSAIDLGYDNFDGAVTTRMITWGSQGVAFNRNGLQILSGSFYGPGTGSSTGSTSPVVTHRGTRDSVRTIFVTRIR